MNEVTRTSEQAVKNIIKTLGNLEREEYEGFWEDIFALINGLEDVNAQLKSYFPMFEKEIEFKNVDKATEIYTIITNLTEKLDQLPPSSELELSYL